MRSSASWWLNNLCLLLVFRLWWEKLLCFFYCQSKVFLFGDRCLDYRCAIRTFFHSDVSLLSLVLDTLLRSLPSVR